MHFPRVYPSISSFSALTGLVAATLLLMCSSAQAANYTWNTTDTNWTPTSGTTPWNSTNGTTSNATFNNANGATVSGTVYANQINKTDSAGTTFITGGNIILAGSSPTITNSGTASLSISSKLSGANGVTVTAGSSGGITFSGSTDSSGTTTINGNPSTNGLTVGSSSAATLTVGNATSYL